MDYEDYDDFYPDDYDPELPDQYEVAPEDYENDSPIQEGMSMSQIYQFCVEPTLFSVSDQLGMVFVTCLIFKIATKIFPGTLMYHLTSFLCGIFGLCSLIGRNALYTLIFSMSTYWLLIFCNRRVMKERSFIGSMFILFAYLIIREYFNFLPESWEQIRGVHMIIVLKALSLCFEVSSFHESGEKKPVPTPIEYLGYIFFPGTIIFGPWIPFIFYKRLHERKQWVFAWVLKVFATSTLAFLFLGISSCWVYWIFLRITSPWILAFRDALSVRFSHYFVALMSEAMCILCGAYSEDGSMNIEVTKPLKIEFPRSLVEVVVYWNRPMHQWLKIHIFRTASRYGPFLAVLFTFMCSSILHGLNFGLSMVLLSLGVYTYVEHQLRKKLSNIFEACIGSRPCSSECLHKYKSNNWIVFLVNLGFGLLAYFHLAYLGIMMDKRFKEDSEELGLGLLENISHQLKRWSRLHYSSHWIIFVTYLGSSVI